MITTKYIDLGLIDYNEAWQKQQEYHKYSMGEQLSGTADREQYLLFCEHPHVYTLGKSGAFANLLIPDEFLKKINASFYKIDRGGDITYHGPGQIVGYPIFDLEELGLGIRSYIEKMENAIIGLLKRYGIEADRLEGATGVWLKQEGNPVSEKICAIGVKVSRMISMHGFALNVNTDLNYFSYINPCGFADKGVTSMSKILNQKIDIEEVKKALKTEIEKEFQIELG